MWRSPAKATLPELHTRRNACADGCAAARNNKEAATLPRRSRHADGAAAIASKYQRQGLGRALVADAVIRTSSLGIGAFALIVDAKDKAAVTFYEANGFMLIPNEPRRLFLPIATALELQAGKLK